MSGHYEIKWFYGGDIFQSVWIEDPVKVTKYVPPSTPVSVIGIQNGTATLQHVEFTTGGTALSFTQTIFDTTTRADSARILLTNSTGSNGILRNSSIRAKVVTKLAGTEGYLHDAYVDYESINANGEMKFELGNDFICILAQVNKLADYNWKNNKTKRHIYTIELVGMQTFFEPGEWYTLTVGSVGTAEYISSVCECYSVRAGLVSGSIGTTSVSFREMYQNWVFDSNEVARSLASGQFNRFPGQASVTVASQTYFGTADYYCDGVSDETEINAALAYLAGKGGGTIVLTEGTFTIGSAILVVGSAITIQGMGWGTLINKSTPGIRVLDCTGPLTRITIRDLRIDAGPSAASGDTISAIYCSQITGLVITAVNILNTGKYGIELSSSDSCQLVNNQFDFSTNTSSEACIIVTSSPNTIVQGNTIKAMRSNRSLYALYIATSRCLCVNNTIYDTSVSVTSMNVGIYVTGSGSNSVVSSNRIESVANSTSSTMVAGIWIATGATSVEVVNNYLFNNGAATGLTNISSNHFLDNGTDTQYAG